MKIETTIKPRRDGKVRVELKGKTYEFSKDDQGRLVADINDESAIQYLFGLGDEFLPADEADFQSAAAIVGKVGTDLDDEDDEDDDQQMAGGAEVDPAFIPEQPPVEDEPIAGGLPIEENTPPSHKKPRKAK